MSVLERVIAALPWGVVKEIRTVEDTPVKQSAPIQDTYIGLGIGHLGVGQLDDPFEEVHNEPPEEPTTLYTKGDNTLVSRTAVKSSRWIYYGASARPYPIRVSIDTRFKIHLHDQHTGTNISIDDLTEWERTVELPRHVAYAIEMGTL